MKVPLPRVTLSIPGIAPRERMSLRATAASTTPSTTKLISVGDIEQRKLFDPFGTGKGASQLLRRQAAFDELSDLLICSSRFNRGSVLARN